MLQKILPGSHPEDEEKNKTINNTWKQSENKKNNPLLADFF